MKKKFISVLLCIAMATLAAGCNTANAPSKTDNASAADYVLKNGVVQTMVSEDDVAQAIAISGDEIIYVGNDEGIADYIGEKTEVIDLQGQMVIPGFIDGHLHPPADYLTQLYEISLNGAESKEDYLEKIKTFIENNPDLEKYTGGQYSLNLFMNPDGSNPGPKKEDLDAICSDKPIVLKDISLHNVWCNSYALEVSGITKDTPDPNGGRIYRNENGEPSGQLSDSAVDLLGELSKTTFTEEQNKDALVEFMKQCNEYGITGVTNIDLSEGSTEIETFFKVEKDGLQTLRVRHAYNSNENESAETTIKNVRALQEKETDMNKCGTVKFWLDGVTEAGTAFMLEPYLPAAGHGDNWYGSTKYDDNKDFIDKVVALDKEGIQSHVHAIGDASVKLTLDAFEKAQKTNNNADPRFSMVHVCAITDEDIQRAADLKVISNLQFVWMYGDALFDLERAYIGEERALAMYPTLKMKEAGCIITGGSDAPVTGYNPLEEIEVGVTRNSPFKGEEDTDMYRAKDQALTAYDVLAAYTKNAAYQNFMEDTVGTLETGKKADITVLSQDIIKCDSKAISDTEVLYTFSNGKVVYQK